MKILNLFFIFSIITWSTVFESCSKSNEEGKPLPKADFTINHENTKLASIPEQFIVAAKKDLHIVYGHTSHGSQLITGMTGLVNFKGNLYAWKHENSDATLDIHDHGMPGDLGNPDRVSWEKETRDYIAAHPKVNVVIWSWCGEVSAATENDINTYLNLMDGLEKDFPNIKFIYMTGHLDGTGLSGNLHIRNEQIRKFCSDNNKLLYDFEDIESYDPDGIYFGDKRPNDNCDYDSDNNGSRDANWAIQWQDSHKKDVDWYQCSSAHSQPLNANQKAYAAWWLWARLAGWDGN
jgi:hypothetical protein